MRKLKTFLCLLLTVTVVIISNKTTILASEQNSLDLNNVAESDLKDAMTNIIKCTLQRDTTTLESYASLFHPNTLYVYKQYVDSNNIGGDLIQIVIDYTTPEYSTTGDTVIMVNTKIQYTSTEKYNKLYLFEFHVNADGVIYGYNIWQY